MKMPTYYFKSNVNKIELKINTSKLKGLENCAFVIVTRFVITWGRKNIGISLEEAGKKYDIRARGYTEPVKLSII